jgi:hypothetical protein
MSMGLLMKELGKCEVYYPTGNRPIVTMRKFMMGLVAVCIVLTGVSLALPI